MPRINIYVSESLDEKMKKHPDINWSQLATGAFNMAIQQQEQAITLTPEFIQRMQEGQEERARRMQATYNEEEEAGKIAGRNWAQAEATFEQLYRLNNHEGWADAFDDFIDNGMDEQMISYVYRIANGLPEDAKEGPFNRVLEEVAEISQKAEIMFYSPDRLPYGSISVQTASGFVEGAKEVFRLATEKLN